MNAMEAARVLCKLTEHEKITICTTSTRFKQDIKLNSPVQEGKGISEHTELAKNYPSGKGESFLLLVSFKLILKGLAIQIRKP